MELPESIVDAVHLHVRRAAAARLIGYKPLHHDQRTDAGVERLELDVVAQLIRERGAEQPGGDDDPIGAAEPLHDEIPQAAADGIADEERAREHRAGRRDTGHHGEIGAPVVAEAVDDKHGGGFSCYGRRLITKITETAEITKVTSILNVRCDLSDLCDLRDPP